MISLSGYITKKNPNTIGHFIRRAFNMPKLVLYKRDASPPSSAVMMLGDILGLQFDYKEVELLQMEHKTPQFRKVNPMGTIPVLQDGDFTVSESHAIVKYLLEKYGGEKRSSLYPVDYEKRALIDERMFFDAGVFFIKLKNVSLPTFLEGLKGPSERQLLEIEDTYRTLELYLESPYIAGDQLSIADICVGSTAMAAESIYHLDSEKFPNTAAWIARLQEEPCFKYIGMKSAELFKQFINYFWEKNNAKK